MKTARILGAVCLLGALGLGGCASFPAEEVPRTTMPSVTQYQQKPGVYVDFKFYQGLPGAGASEIGQAREHLRPALERRLDASGLFSRYTLDPAQKREGDYVLRLKMYNHGSSGGAAVSGFISGLTLGIIPGTAKDEYSMTLEVLDPQNQPLQSMRNHDAIRTWMGWIFLPMAGNTPDKAVNDTFGRQVDALLKELYDSRQLQYSALRMQRAEG
jgi:hypothetical protein